jgi:hypothetical protein
MPSESRGKSLKSLPSLGLSLRAALAGVLVRSALPDPTVGRSAINLIDCRSPVKRKRFNDRTHRDGQRCAPNVLASGCFDFIFFYTALFIDVGLLNVSSE